MRVASFQNASHLEEGFYSKDREALGLTLLSCIDGPGNEQSRTCTQVRNLIKEQKLFGEYGLKNITLWIGTTGLIDFITFLFRDATLPGKIVSTLTQPRS